MTSKFEAFADKALREIAKMSNDERLNAAKTAMEDVYVYLKEQDKSEKDVCNYFFKLIGNIISADREYSDAEYQFVKEAFKLSVDKDFSYSEFERAQDFLSDEKFAAFIDNADDEIFSQLVMLAFLIVSSDRTVTYSEKVRVYNIFFDQAE